MNIKEISKYFLSQVGYHEKASNKDLYTDKNNGHKNYTKYADILKYSDLLNGNKQAVAWCAVFIIANFYSLFGEKTTHDLLNLPKNSAGAGCPFLYDYLKGFYIDNEPAEGDLIFFGDKKPNHVGYVYKVQGSKVFTVEGNTDDQVKKHTYAINSKKIYGYVRPRYELINNDINLVYKYKVTAISGLRVRKEPNTNCDVLRILKFGTKVLGTPYNENWISTQGGFISSKWVEKVK